MGRLVETGQVIVTDSKNSIAVQTLIPPDYIEWIREVNNKVIFKIEDRVDYLKSRNLEHYINELEFFKDSMNRYWFYYTRGGGRWKKHEPIPLVDPKKNLDLSRF